MASFNLSDYVTVAERLTMAQDKIATVVSEPPVMLTDVMGYIRATVALGDGRSATATASFRLDLQGKSAQATNPIEDCETSAIGRALGFLGYGASKSIASREEVQEAQRRGGAAYSPPTPEPTNGHSTAPLCSVHNKPMREGKNGGYFCATKLEDGSWCKARAAKPTLTQEQRDEQEFARKLEAKKGARTIPDEWTEADYPPEDNLL